MGIDERLDKIDKELQALVETVAFYSNAYNKLSRMFYSLVVALFLSGTINVTVVDDILSIAKESDKEQTKPDEEVE